MLQPATLVLVILRSVMYFTESEVGRSSLARRFVLLYICQRHCIIYTLHIYKHSAAAIKCGILNTSTCFSFSPSPSPSRIQRPHAMVGALKVIHTIKAVISLVGTSGAAFPKDGETRHACIDVSSPVLTMHAALMHACLLLSF